MVRCGFEGLFCGGMLEVVETCLCQVELRTVWFFWKCFFRLAYSWRWLGYYGIWFSGLKIFLHGDVVNGFEVLFDCVSSEWLRCVVNVDCVVVPVVEDSLFHLSGAVSLLC